MPEHISDLAPAEPQEPATKPRQAKRDAPGWVYFAWSLWILSGGFWLLHACVDGSLGPVFLTAVQTCFSASSILLVADAAWLFAKGWKR